MQTNVCCLDLILFLPFAVGQAPAMYGQEQESFVAPSSFAAQGPNTMAYSFLALGGLASAALFYLFNQKVWIWVVVVCGCRKLP